MLFPPAFGAPMGLPAECGEPFDGVADEDKAEKHSCPHCGKQMSEKLNFCPHCGKTVSE